MSREWYGNAVGYFVWKGVPDAQEKRKQRLWQEKGKCPEVTECPEEGRTNLCGGCVLNALLGYVPNAVAMGPWFGKTEPTAF